MTRLPIVIRIAYEIHRVSLIVHPRVFREEFGTDLEDSFLTKADEVLREGGALQVVVLLVRTLVDTVTTALVERRTLRAFCGGTAKGEGTRYQIRGGGGVMETIMRDLRVGARVLMRRPVFAGVAIGTLALGIGANTAIFSVVHGVLLDALPFPEPEQLVRLYHVNEGTGNERGSFSLPDREDWAERSLSLSSVAVYSTLPSGLLLTGGDEATEVRTAYVSSGFFDVLGREAHLGRVLRNEEEYGDNRVVVLSHAFWQRRFGGDPSLVGSQVQLDDTAFLVAGVMPPEFAYPSPEVEAWVFLTIIPASSTPLHLRQVRFLEALGRIRTGTTIEQATSELSAVAASLSTDFPEENEGLERAVIVPLRESMTGDVASTLLVLLSAVGLVLLIACSNVASLLFSRALERGREIEIRRALGGGRSQLVRQLLTESLLLSVLGGAAGLALAYWGTEALLARGGGLLPRASEVEISGTVLMFSIGLTLLAALLSGLLPALKMTGGTSFQATTRTGRRQGASRTWTVLVAGQVGLAMLVVIASGLLLRSLWALQAVDNGMESDRLVALSLTINDARYPERAAYLAAYAELMERLDGLPGIESVASIRYLPLRRSGESVEFQLIDGSDAAAGDEPARASLLQVSPGFFETAGVHLLGGREFTNDDRAESPLVAIVNESLQKRYWPGRSPVGEIVLGRGGAELQIVAVVANIHQRSLAEEPEPTLYVPQAQNPRRGMAFVLRTQSDPASMLADVRAVVQAVDPDQPIEDLSVMNDVVFASTAQPRFFSLLLASFALLSLALATLGIYGVVSHAVSTRVPEIGIRMALGAPKSGVVGMVVTTGMRPVFVGAAVGLGAAMLAMPWMSSILYGVSTRDPITFVAVPLLLIAAALLACWLPAARAVRIDPTVALRAQ